MHPARMVRVAAAASLAAAVLATSACSSLDKLTQSSPSPSAPTYPATVDGGGTPMSPAGCEQFAGQDPQPLQCQPVPDGQAYLSLTDGSQTYGQQGYVGVDQFKASCTKDETTLTGPDGITLVFTSESRKVEVSRAGAAIGSYDDPDLWWITHTSVSTNGTNKVGGATVSVSVRITCQLPEETRTPVPNTTPIPAESAAADEPA